MDGFFNGCQRRQRWDFIDKYEFANLPRYVFSERVALDIHLTLLWSFVEPRLQCFGNVFGVVGAVLDVFSVPVGGVEGGCYGLLPGRHPSVFFERVALDM